MLSCLTSVVDIVLLDNLLDLCQYIQKVVMLADLRYSLRNALISAKLRLIDFLNSFPLYISTIDIYFSSVLQLTILFFYAVQHFLFSFRVRNRLESFYSMFFSKYYAILLQYIKRVIHQLGVVFKCSISSSLKQQGYSAYSFIFLKIIQPLAKGVYIYILIPLLIVDFEIELQQEFYLTNLVPTKFLRSSKVSQVLIVGIYLDRLNYTAKVQPLFFKSFDNSEKFLVINRVVELSTAKLLGKEYYKV